jgi:NitT/TauT family transport system permease protein
MIEHIAASLLRLAAGIIIALAIALPTGITIAISKKAAKLASPIIYLAFPIPKLALLPVVIIALGIGNAAKITMIVLILVFQLTIAVRDATKNIPALNFHILKALGANRWQQIRWIILPAIAPDVITALRVAIGTAASVLFFTETLGADKGLGLFIVNAWMTLQYLDMAVGIATLSVLCCILFVALDRLEKYACKWKH